MVGFSVRGKRIQTSTPGCLAVTGTVDELLGILKRDQEQQDPIVCTLN